MRYLKLLMILWQLAGLYYTALAIGIGTCESLEGPLVAYFIFVAKIVFSPTIIGGGHGPPGPPYSYAYVNSLYYFRCMNIVLLLCIDRA